MKATDLHVLWNAPDNSRVTSKQYSFRLPVHVAAKIEALGEMLPTRSRTQIVADLLAAALDDYERAFPSVKGKELGTEPESGEQVYEDVGMCARFQKLANKHYVAIEKEMGTDKPTPLYPAELIRLASEF